MGNSHSHPGVTSKRLRLIGRASDFVRVRYLRKPRQEVPVETDPLEHPGSQIRDPTRWLNKSIWSILDQGFFSLSNLATNILLANKLGTQNYGAFTVAFSYFLVLAVFHNAFLTEPALIFGQGRYRKQLNAYLGALLCGHGLISALIMMMLLAAGLLYYWAFEARTGLALTAFAIATPFLLLLWLMRRTCYVDSQPRRAAVGDGIYLALMLLGLVFLAETDNLSIITAIALMATCSLAASILLLFRERPMLPAGQTDLLRSVRKHHWVYGRWAATTGIAAFIPGQMFYPLLESISGLSSAGMLRAYSNLVMPFFQANVAMGMLLLPMLVRSRGTPRFNRIAFFGLVALSAPPIVLTPLLVIFPTQLLNLFYSGAYPTYTGLMWAVAVQAVLSGAFAVFNIALQSYQKPKFVFYASLVAAVITIVIGLPLTGKYGATGAAVSISTGLAVNVVVSGYFCWKVIWAKSRYRRKSIARAKLAPRAGDLK